MNTARAYKCDRCGHETVEGDGWQANVIFIDRNGRPRIYELCHECTVEVSRFLEGRE